MTATDIAARILGRLDDESGAGLSVAPDPYAGIPPEVLAAINEGYRLAAMLTLCLEQESTLTLPANASVVDVREQLGDYLVPLRLEVAGMRLRPGTLSEFDGLDEQWTSRAGAADRYATLGFGLLFLNRQAASSTAGKLTYARTPVALAAGDTPLLPEAYHLDLVDYGLYRVRLKEGAQGLARAVKYFNHFLDRMTTLGDFVRARSRAARYDTLPCELQLFDRSRLALAKAKA